MRKALLLLMAAVMMFAASSALAERQAHAMQPVFLLIAQDGEILPVFDVVDETHIMLDVKECPHIKELVPAQGPDAMNVNDVQHVIGAYCTLQCSICDYASEKYFALCSYENHQWSYTHHHMLGTYRHYAYRYCEVCCAGEELTGYTCQATDGSRCRIPAAWLEEAAE